MNRFFVSPEQICGQRIIISGEDYNHIKNVLRLKTGEEISVRLSEEREYDADNQERELITSDREKVITNDREKIITSDREKVITSDYEKVIVSGDEKVIANDDEKVIVRSKLRSKEYRCEIDSYTDSEVICKLRFIKEADTELPVSVYLFQALPKGDKMETIIQKCVELGVYKIIPVSTKRCVMKISDQKATKKIERWNKIAKSAAEQSGRAIIPQVEMPLTFCNALTYAEQEGIQYRWIPDELADNTQSASQTFAALQSAVSLNDNLADGVNCFKVAIFIGSEGGFERSEVIAAIKGGFIPISLGRRILRTETAGMAVLSMLIYLLEIQA